MSSHCFTGLQVFLFYIDVHHVVVGMAHASLLLQHLFNLPGVQVRHLYPPVYSLSVKIL